MSKTTFEIATRQTGEHCRPTPEDHPSAKLTTHLKTVEGDVVAQVLGIHKGAGGWVLTDLWSGCRLISTRTRMDAHRLAQNLVELYDDQGRWHDEAQALSTIGAHLRAYTQGRWLSNTPEPAPEPVPAPSNADQQATPPPAWRSASQVRLDDAMFKQLVAWLIEQRGAVYVSDLPLSMVAPRALAVWYDEAYVIMPCPDYHDTRAIVADKMLVVFARLEGITPDALRALIAEGYDD
jgi:hypothetical protein